MTANSWTSGSTTNVIEKAADDREAVAEPEPVSADKAALATTFGDVISEDLSLPPGELFPKRKALFCAATSGFEALAV